MEVSWCKYYVSERGKDFSKDGTICFEPFENVNIFKKFYSELATNLANKLPIAPNKFNIHTTKD